jgi:hypothetical protein
MSEGRFWLCTWVKTTDGYKAWVINRPKIVGNGATWQDTLDDLGGAICLATGDGEGRMRFDPPEPTDARISQWAHPKLCRLDPEGDVRLTVLDPRCFTGGLCKGCDRPVGSRTNVPLVAIWPGEGDLCYPNYIAYPYRPVMISERLFALLTRAELATCRMIPVQPAPRTRKRYIELVPKRFIPRVAVRGWTCWGIHCKACGDTDVSCTPDAELNWATSTVTGVASSADVPKRPPAMLAFGSVHDWGPVLPIDRACDLVRNPNVAGTRISEFVTVPPELVDKNVKLAKARKLP